MSDILDKFSPATAAWFRGSFAAPTPAQAGAWDAISAGSHTLVVAPTGSGKTLSAFLWALDRLAASGPVAEKKRRCRVVYVSPLKALAVDVERNLASPLVGIRHAADRLGQPAPDITIATRSGDTPPEARRAFARTPSDILITTPESLYLMLTSAAREALAGVETVIVDEIHAVAASKRGAHLALTLERLDALLEAPAQRIGLSATVRPIDEVARFLAGGRPTTIVAPPAQKSWDLSVVVPVPDLGDLGQPDAADEAAAPNRSIWPHVEERIVDLVAQSTSTLIFANSRRLAERLTARLNEVWVERLEAAGASPGGSPSPTQPPAEVMGAAGAAAGAPPVLARAHHGSVSKEVRATIEEDLKAGRLPAVVATSSLELGIDMGAIDLVVQVESPPSVASGLQRVGRAGHQVGATSRGVLFPKFRGDLVQTAVVTERMRGGDIEELALPGTPLDVLAQQIVAMCALDDWAVDDVLALARRTASYARLSRAVLDSVLEMLSGKYPSEAFAELRARVTWDRLTDTLSGRRGTQRLAVTSGGTIPDRGLYAVMLASGDGPGRRVGELDEEMVYESRVGDVFMLGTSSWLITDITHDQVLVVPAPGQPGRLPFWKGDQAGRPAELGAAIGEFVREVAALAPEAARERVLASGLDEWATDNLVRYLDEQREATGIVPSDATVVVERFRDEMGDWRIVVHSPFGARVHAPWALILAGRLRERLGIDVQSMHGDDGIVLRLPDFEDTTSSGFDELADLLVIDPDEVRAAVTDVIGGSALFAARFRECAARALLLPRRQPGRRQPLWQQRQRASQLLDVASNYPDFPIVLETVREVSQDVFDVPGLVRVMAGLATRDIALHDVTTSTPSPFASSLMFGYVAQFLYEGDSPLAERRAAALSLDPNLLAELLGTSEGLSLRDLLAPEQVESTQAQLQRLTENRRARDADDVLDLLRDLGPMSMDDVALRTAPEVEAATLTDWLADLERTRQVIQVRINASQQWAAISDAARLRDALGVSLPPGVPSAFLEAVPDPLGDLILRHARTHGPFEATDVAARFGLGVAVALDALTRLVTAGAVVTGEFLPVSGGAQEYCEVGVLRMLRRRSLAALRAEVEPVTAKDLTAFVHDWQGLTKPRAGSEALIGAVEQLTGVVLPASALESFVLPARVSDYTPAMLDEVLATGEVVWAGHGALPGDDGWVSLHLRDAAALTLPIPSEAPASPAGLELLSALADGGGYFFDALAQRAGIPPDGDAQSALWDLVWSSRVTGDTFAPIRALLAGGRGAHKGRPAPVRVAGGRRRRTSLGAPGSAARSAGLGTRSTAPGRFSLLPSTDEDPTRRAHLRAEVLLDRYGIVTRGVAVAESVPGGFAAVYQVLARAEEAGRVRRGYFVEGLGASQFATGPAVDRLRARPASRDDSVSLLAATDPAQPFGSALPWPPPIAAAEQARAQPGRKAGALVVLVGDELACYVERGGRSALTFTESSPALARVAQHLAHAVRRGHVRALVLERLNGVDILGSDQPFIADLLDAGFHLTPRGVRIRR